MAHARRDHRHIGCCPAHAAMMLSGLMGAHRYTPEGPAEPPRSFTDQTPQTPSRFASASDAATRDLYEVAGRGRPIVVRGGTILPMTSAATLRDHDVLAVDGVIKAVQPAGGAWPDDALVVDAGGRFVIPGLTDIHTHPRLRHAADMWAPLISAETNPEDLVLPYDLTMFLYLAGGMTRIEIMAGTAEELALRDAIRAGRMRGPAMRVASPVIDGPPSMWAPMITWLVSDADGGRKAAQQVAERGFDFAKPYSRLNREAYEALMAECRALGVRTMGHVPTEVGVEDALEMGQQGVAHLMEYFYYETGEARSDPDVIARRARLSARHGVVVQSTLVISRILEYDCGYLPDGYPFDETLDPLLRFVMKDTSPFIQTWRNDPVMVETGRDAIRLSADYARALVAEGVRLLPGTDNPSPNVVYDLSVHEELRMLVDEVGLSPMDVLRAATVRCAEHQGEGAVAGTIERGKRSDLVVLERDPTLDIGATRTIDAVIIGDAVLRKEAIAKGIARAKELYAAMPIPA